MAATISLERLPLLDEGETSDGTGSVLQPFRKDKVELFCDCMTEIESIREEQIERLKRSLRVTAFPAGINISDPDLLPFLSPKVRAVVEAFPFQAEEIVKKYGLESEEFNQMLHETKSNPIFRWKVQRLMKVDHPHDEQNDGAKTHEEKYSNWKPQYHLKFGALISKGKGFICSSLLHMHILETQRSFADFAVQILLDIGHKTTT